MKAFTKPIVRTPHPCWLCSHAELGARDDLHFRPHWLCRSCWTRQPAARNEETRAAEAVAGVLDVPNSWRSTFRWQWVQQAAAKSGIKAWEDHRTVKPGVPVPAPGAAFGWIPADAREAAAAHLAQCAEEFDRNRLGAH